MAPCVTPLGAAERIVQTLRRPQVRAVAETAGLNLLTVALGGMGGVLLARALGPADRGELAVILLWPAIAWAVASFGTTEATCYWTSRDRTAAASIATTAAGAALITGIGVALLGGLIAPTIARTLVAEHGLILLFVLSPVNICSAIWLSSLQALDIRHWNVARAVLPTVYFGAILGLWAFGALTLGTAVGSYSVGLVAQATYAWVKARAAIGRPRGFRTSDLRRLYGYGWKVWLASVPQIVNVRVDLLVLSLTPTIGASELGNYAVAASLSMLALPISAAFGSIAFPRIAASKGQMTERIERLSIAGAGIAATTIMLLLTVCAPVWIPRLFGAGFKESVGCLWLLAPGTVCLAVNRVLTDLLQGRGRPLYTSVCEGTGAGVTVIALFFLVPRFGIEGAAAASSISYGLVTMLLLAALSAVRRSCPEAVRDGNT